MSVKWLAGNLYLGLESSHKLQAADPLKFVLSQMRTGPSRPHVEEAAIGRPNAAFTKSGRQRDGLSSA